MERMKLSRETRPNRLLEKRTSSSPSRMNVKFAQTSAGIQEKDETGSSELEQSVVKGVLGTQIKSSTYTQQPRLSPDSLLTKEYLKTLTKRSKVEAENVEKAVNESQSLSVFSLSSDDIEKETKSTGAKPKSSYLKANFIKEKEETKSTLGAQFQKSRVSDALLKAQLFSEKYKKTKNFPEDKVLLEPAKKMNDSEMSTSISLDDILSLSVASKSSTKSSTIHSLLNVKDLLLDLPLTSPEVQAQEKVDEESEEVESEEEQESSQMYESDFEVATQTELPTSADHEITISSSRKSITKSEISEELVDKSEETIASETYLSQQDDVYTTDFEEEEESKTTAKSISLSESETLVSSPETIMEVSEKKPNLNLNEGDFRKNVGFDLNQQMKTRPLLSPSEMRKKPEVKVEKSRVSRGTQTMTRREINLDNFYGHFNVPPAFLHSYLNPLPIYATFIDPIVINDVKGKDSPTKVLLDTMMKQQLQYVRSLIDLQRQNYVLTVKSLKSDYHYTTWEETRKKIERLKLKRKNKKKDG